MTKARELSKLLSGTLKVGALKAPAGTTAQRPTPQVGMVRYNSTSGKNEVYDSEGWTAIASPPQINSVSPSTYNGEQGTSFTINGAFFDSGAVVKFITNTGTEYSAATVSRISASQLIATTPQDFTVAQEPLKVKVINSSGLSYILDAAIDCGGSPTWSTSAGNLATVVEDEAISNITLIAGDPDSGATISFALANSSSLPNGLSLSSGGIITGTPNVNDAYSTGVTHNFDVTAMDNAGNQTVRSFNIIRKWRDGSSALLASTSAAAIKAINSGATDGLYYITAGGITQQLYCDMTTAGGPWMLVASNYFNDSTFAQGGGRLSTSYELDRSGAWGNVSPNSDYLIGSMVNSLPFTIGRVVGFGYNDLSASRVYKASQGTSIEAIWTLGSSGVGRLTNPVPRGSVTVNGDLSSLAAYFVLDGIKADRIAGGFSANTDQTTVGGVGVQGSNGDPTSGCYLGHGQGEGSTWAEGWYNGSNNAFNCAGYTTWVK